MSRFVPLAPEPLLDRLAEVVTGRHPGDHPARVALDRPGFVGDGDLLAGLTDR